MDAILLGLDEGLFESKEEKNIRTGALVVDRSYRATELTPNWPLDEEIELDPSKSTQHQDFINAKKKAELLSRLGRWTEAAELFGELSKFKMTIAHRCEFLDGQARSLIEAREYEAALGVLEIMRKERPKDPAILVLFAKCQDCAQDLDTAIMAWGEVLAQSQRNAMHWAHLMEAYLRRNQPHDLFLARRALYHAKFRCEAVHESASRYARLQARFVEVERLVASARIEDVREESLNDFEKNILMQNAHLSATPAADEDDARDPLSM